MMHLCRDIFSTILETPGELSDILDTSFAQPKYLYDDLIENDLLEQFKEYIYKRQKNIEEELNYTTKTPHELLKTIGYNLYECNTENDIQSFKKYYKREEELCTFKGRRLDSCLVFFAVKDNADKLKREDFKEPRREDDYGISVISIQFSRKNYSLSIKNRYNHTVNNPDATYGNNLENIVPGLTMSFEKYLGNRINQSKEGNFEIKNYTELDGKFYKYNYEINNVHYCPNNIIIDNGEVIEYPQEQYIIMDYFILDLKNKKISIYKDNITDSFINQYENIEKIEIKKEKDTKILTITTKENIQSIITINNKNKMIAYENKEIKELESYYLKNCKALKNINMPNVEKIGEQSFYECKNLKKLYIPNVFLIDKKSFMFCGNLEKLDLENVMRIRNSCFYHCESLKEVNTPNLELIEHSCFNDCNSLEKINIPKVKKLEYSCFSGESIIEKLYAPNLESMGNCCFQNNKKMKEIILPNTETVGNSCFYNTEDLENLKIDNLKTIRELSFYNSKKLKQLIGPNLQAIGNNSFRNCRELLEIDAPNLIMIGSGSFAFSALLEKIIIPKKLYCQSDNVRTKFKELEYKKTKQ